MGLAVFASNACYLINVQYFILLGKCVFQLQIMSIFGLARGETPEIPTRAVPLYSATDEYSLCPSYLQNLATLYTVAAKQRDFIIDLAV